MSYEIKLTSPDSYIIKEEDEIIDYDKKTAFLVNPTTNTIGVVVRFNDFIRQSDFTTEVIIREDVSDQITVFNNKTIFVKQGPIYDGLKVGNLSNDPNDVVVKIFIVDEDVSEQFTGIENFCYVQGRPILKSNDFDFSSLILKSDIIVKKNSIALTSNEIYDVNSKTGRIQLTQNPIAGDIVTVSYCFRAKVKSIDSINSRIDLKEKPVISQKVLVQYFAKVNDGWEIYKIIQKGSLYSYKIVFFGTKNTNRIFVENENVTSQVDGETNFFQLANKPLLPLHQTFYTTYKETLNNSVSVLVNGTAVSVDRVDPTNGIIKTYIIPQLGDIVLINYYYENNLIPDRVSVDYSVEQKYYSRNSGNSDLADYRVDNLGDYEKIYDENKLIQDSKKIVVTQIKSDPVATWYGTNFESIIATKQLPDYVKTRISSEIIEALTNLKNAQILQQDYQEVTPNEFLDHIQKLTVEQDLVDPTFYKVSVSIYTQAGKNYEVVIPIIFNKTI
jgi:hypothetical protein